MVLYLRSWIPKISTKKKGGGKSNLGGRQDQGTCQLILCISRTSVSQTCC